MSRRKNTVYREESGMTPKAYAAYKLYRDAGPTRTLEALAASLGLKSPRAVERWSAQYGWQKLVAEHDHRALRDSLGQREVVRERANQLIVDTMGEAVMVLLNIIRDDSKLPILDRNGAHVKGPNGELLFRPLVKASTKAQAAQHLLAVGGLVPVKRLEVKDATPERLDEAAKQINTLSPEQVEGMLAIATKDDAEG